MIYIPAYKQLAGRTRNVRLVVMHATQSPERKGAARAVANWFANPDAGGSAHVTCDADEDVESVKPHNTAAGAPGANQDGYHIEQVGYSEQNAVQWDDDYSQRVIARSAARASWACEHFGLPKVWLSVTDIRAGKSGITDHVSCTLAFKKGSHWDPGPNWPRSKFMRLVTGATPTPPPEDDEDMFTLQQIKQPWPDTRVWCVDDNRQSCWYVEDEDVLAVLKGELAAKKRPAEIIEVSGIYHKALMDTPGWKPTP